MSSFDSLAFWCKRLGLPEPIPEVRFAAHRKFRLDASWPDRMIALEIDGGVWMPNGGGRHNRGTGFLRDMEKLNLAAAMGYRVFRFTPQQVRSGEAALFLKEEGVFRIPCK